MKTNFKIFLITTFLGFVLFLLLSLSCSARVRYIKPSGYACFSVGFIPLVNNTGNLSCNLSVGYGGNMFVEYSQIIGLSSSVYVPKMFCVRSGYSFRFDCLELRPFAGIGVMPVTSLEDSREAKPVYCGGVSLLQDIHKDFKIKYELSVNNGYIIPSIGMHVEF